MQLRTTVLATVSLVGLTLSTGAWACGGDEDNDDTKEPSVLCGGDEDNDDTKEPSVLL